MGSEISVIDSLAVSIQHSLTAGIDQVALPAVAGLLIVGLCYSIFLTILHRQYSGK